MKKILKATSSSSFSRGDEILVNKDGGYLVRNRPCRPGHGEVKVFHGVGPGLRQSVFSLTCSLLHLSFVCFINKVYKGQ